MAIAEGMKAIAQDIASTREDRLKGVAGMKQETQDSIKALHASRGKEATQMHQELAHGEAARKEAGNKLRRNLARGLAELKSEVNKSMRDMRSHQEAMGTRLRKELADYVHGIKSEVAGMRQETKADLGEARTALRKELAAYEASRHEMDVQLRKELADYVHGIKSEVAGMRQETIADLAEARTAWQELTGGVKKAAVKATPKVVKAQVAKAVPSEMETPDLKAKFLAAIKEHPEGITLTEVAGNLGVAPIVFGRAAKKLLGEGKIRKQDKAYFPARARQRVAV